MKNIVQIGYGYWGANVARNIMASPKTNLVAICDMNEQKLANAKKAFGDKVQYSNNYHQFLQDDSVDGIALVIQTEPSFAVAKEVLNAGKHLFIEKPIATNSERAQEILALAAEKGLVVHCDHLMVYHPVIRYIKKMHDDGELGDLMYVDVSRINLGPIRKDVNSMLDLAVHDLAVIDYLSNGAEPIEVSALGDARYGNQESLTYLTLKYPDFIAHIKTSWLSPLKERRVMIGGTKKMVIFDDMKHVDKLTIYDHGIEEIEQSDEYGLYEFKARTGDILIPNIQQEDSLRNSIEHFVDSVNNKRDSLSGPSQALRVMKILDRATKELNNEDEAGGKNV